MTVLQTRGRRNLYRALYDATLAEDPGLARGHEHTAMLRLMSEVADISRSSGSPRATAIAACNLNSVWSAFIEDLASASNDLPSVTRAQLISIGLYVLRQADIMRRGEQVDLRALEEIHASVADGLR